MAAIITQTGNNILDPKKYSEKDLTLIGEFPIESEFTPTTDIIEYYVYDINNNLVSYLPEFNRFSVVRDDPSTGASTNQISLNVENNLRDRGYFEGTYQTVYNFFRNKLNSSESERFFIKEISPSRTEIRLFSNTLDNSTLDILVSDFLTERNQSEYFEDFLLNFGSNQQFVASNIILDDADSSKYSVLIKLYDPLPNNFEVNDTCWVCVEVADPKTFLVEFERVENEVDNRLFLQGPNFNIEVKDEISNATNYKTLNDLLDNTELTSSYNQLQNLLDQKGISLNIDYGLDTVDFKNFTYFSSAEQRIRNFYYKVGLIENANNNITSIDGLSGTPDVSSSLATYEQTITDTIKSFDGFEFFMYYNSSSQGTGGTTWPKSNSTSPYTLQSTGSSDVNTWYTRMLNSASAYDQENSNNLIYTIPEYLRDDPQNAPYELFIEMMGQYFDQLYFYVEDITNKYDADNRLNFGVSKDIVTDVLKSFGIKLYENNFSSNDLYSSLLGINASGSLLPPTGSEVINTYITASDEAIPLNDVNKETYKRIYHNMPYLLKKKGTVEGVRALISLFGIPDTILRISEFGGKDKDNTNDWDYTQNVFNYSTLVTGSGDFSSVISASTQIHPSWSAYENSPEAISFRFKPSNIFPTSPDYVLLAEFDDGNSSPATWMGLTLQYTGSGYSSGSYSGSIPSASNQYATLSLQTNSETQVSLTAPIYNGNWWSINLSRTPEEDATVVLQVAEKIYNGKDGFKIGYYTSSEGSDSTENWVSSRNLILPCSNSRVFNSEIYRGVTGSYQELRYYNVTQSEATFHDFTMNPFSIEGKDYSSSAENLIFRAPLGSDLLLDKDYNTSSIHPKVTGSTPNITQSFSSSTNSGFNDYFIGPNTAFVSNSEFIYQDQVASGIRNKVSDKIKFITADTASGDTLTPYTSIRQYYPQSESYTRDVNYVEVAFSPQNEINDDINSSFGYFNIGEYIGDPGYVSESATSYTSLNKLRDTYFEKYYKNYNWTDYIRLIKYFDNSLFKMIKDFVPAKSSLATGVVIKQHLLERNRQRPVQVESAHQDNYSGSIKSQQYWDNIESFSIMSSSLIESIGGGSATGRSPQITNFLFSGSIATSGSYINDATLGNIGSNPATLGAHQFISGSDASSSGIWQLDDFGWISMSLPPDQDKEEYYKLPVFSIQHRFGAYIGFKAKLTASLSSSMRGIVDQQIIQFGAGTGNIPIPGTNYATIETIFNPISLIPRAAGTEYFSVYVDVNELNVATNFKYSAFQDADFKNLIQIKAANLGDQGNTNVISGSQASLKGYATDVNSPEVRFEQAKQLENPDSYEIEIDSPGGRVTQKIEDTRQLYDGEWAGTEFQANDQILSTASFEGSSVEFEFSTDYTGSNGSFWTDCGFAPGAVFIDTNVSNYRSWAPSGSNVTRGQIGIGGVFRTVGMDLPKNMITFYVPTLPDRGKEENVFNFDDFNSLDRVTHFLLSISSSFSIDGGEFQYTSSIENLINSFNPGDIFSLQIEEDFTGFTGTSEQYKVANIILGNQKQIKNNVVLFSIANPEEVYRSFAGNWGAMVSHSIHKVSSTQFNNPGNVPPEFLDNFYHTGQNAANIKFKLIRQKPISKNTVMPTEGNLNDNRKNKNYFQVDYETGLITPTNQLAIQNKTAQLAPVPESNYSITGISNSRYNGSKVSSPGINRTI